MDAEMPWMWWGIECKLKGTGRPQQVLSDELTQLVAHHRALITRSETKDLTKSALISVASFATSIVVPSVSDLISISQTSKEMLAAAKSGIRRKREDRIDADDSPRADLVVEIFNLLKMIGKQKAPIVIVVEDAHLADSSLLGLLDNVFSQNSRLPVLCVCLTWPDELAKQRSASEGQSFGAWLNHVHSVAPQSAEVHTLTRLDSDALESIVRRTAPHTNPAVINALVSRADGNPLILSSLLEVPRVKNSLTPDGDIAMDPSEVAELPQEYRAILQARWDGLPSDVQLALCLAALQGRRFVRELVVSSYEAMGKREGTSGSLDRAVDPIGWIRELEDHLRFYEEYNYELAADGVDSFLGSSKLSNLRILMCRQITAWKAEASWPTLPSPTQQLLFEIHAATAGALTADDCDEALIRSAETSAHELATKWRMVGRSSEALDLLSPLLTLLSETGAASAAELVRGKTKLGVLLGESGRYSEALAAEESAVALSASAFGERAPDTLAARGNLSGTLRNLGHLSAARDMAQEVYEGWVETEGEGSSRARWALRHLAMMEQACGHYETALSQIDSLVEVTGSALDGRDPLEDGAVLLGAKGALLYHLGRYDEAVRAQREGLDVLEAHLPADDVRVLAARNN
ncbi:MAG: tetratricopeptide repeat protein, partial [Actinomycetes bacterium]